MNALRVVLLGIFVLAGLPVAVSPQATGLSSISLQSLLRQAAAGEALYLPYVSTGASGAGGPPRGLVADHTSIAQFDSLSATAIGTAAARSVLFMHQSTGGYIDGMGLNCLAGLQSDPAYYPQECVGYADNRSSGAGPWYDRSKWAWDMWPEPQADAIAKMDQFVAIVNERQAAYQIIGMKFCYVDGWNQDADNYITKMSQLEAQYPSKVFIWATSALWNTPGSACDPGNPFNSCLAISQFNQAVRAYARAHNKPLYDIADIESDGGSCQVGGYEGLCSQYNSGGGGHPNAEGAIRLAKGFWWLMANLPAVPTAAAVAESSRSPTADRVVNIVRGGLRFR